MITYSVNHQKAEATTPKINPSPQTFLTTTVQLAGNVNKLLFLISCFCVLCLQLCVHRPARMGAGASGPTGVTAVQDGADMTAPGDLTHKHTLFQTPALLFNCFSVVETLFSALKVSFLLLLALSAPRKRKSVYYHF